MHLVCIESYAMHSTQTKKAAHFLLASAALFFSAGTTAGESLNCLLVNKVGDAGELKTLTNRQVENGLCIISKQAVTAIGAKDAALQEICTRATMHMMLEFSRRFPGRSHSETAGKC